MEFNDHTAALRAHNAWRREISATIRPMSRGWLADRHMRYGPEATAPSAFAFAHMVEDTVRAETCWMSHEMMHLTQTAMEGFAVEEPFAVEDAFIPHGFLALPEPFYVRDVNGMMMATRAFLWRVVDPGCVIVTEADGDISYTYDFSYDHVRTEPVLRITTISHIDDEDDFNADPEYAEMIEQGRATGMMWGVVHATAIPLMLVNQAKDVRGEGDQQAGWLRFWRVMQKLMSETIVTSERRQAARPARREAARQGWDPGAPRVIELRRPRKHESDPEGERVRDVNWTHRWIVGGHWRQQWYPSIGAHRQRWIGAYEKGPENLPLVIRERVWNWDR